MGDGQGGGSGILALLGIAVCAVMYYVFHIVGFGWILKAIVALLILEAQKRREAELKKFDEMKK